MRDFIIEIKNTGKKNLVGVEVGVKYGENAFDILKHLDIDTLFLVDPWVCYTSEIASTEELKVGYNDQTVMDKWYNTVKEAFQFDRRVKINRCTSKYMANQMIEKVDFVYIDAIHKYKNILEDCSLWYDHVKPGGFLCGHDWNNDECGDQVQKAVYEFANDSCLDVYNGKIDWWIIKQ